MAENNKGRMAVREAGLRGGEKDLIPPIEGVIDAVSKEEDHFRFVGKTDCGVDISVDMEPGEMLANVGGLIIKALGGHAEFDIEPGSRFRLKFELKRKTGTLKY